MRIYLITKAGERLSWKVGTWLSDLAASIGKAPRVERGWVRLWGGRYHMDPGAYILIRFRKFWIPWAYRQEWGIYFTEGNPQPHKFFETESEVSTSRTSWAISEAMDRTWIEQALRRPGLDIKTILLFVLAAVVIIQAVAVIA